MNAIYTERLKSVDMHVFGNSPEVIDVNRMAEGLSGHRAYVRHTADLVLTEAETGPFDGEAILGEAGMSEVWLHRSDRGLVWTTLLTVRDRYLDAPRAAVRHSAIGPSSCAEWRIRISSHTA